jgi:hypothetical protein
MQNSDNRSLTSHVGSLPRPDELIAANRARELGESTDETGFQQRRAGQRLPHRQCLLPGRRGVPLRLRRGDA